ncbi:hypothetical protein [Marinifilum fragile]|uniref:hypothetical protein n=1 Tax=Marinifilum fragile TaxID=570161 RepID=UPI002AA6AAAE|nr:hypothetical protein [Marinifilum fragile]
MSTLNTLNLQIAFFFKEDFSKSFEWVSLKVQEEFGPNPSVNYIPLDNSAPNDLPRVEIIYNTFRIQCAKNRIDLIMDSSPENINLINKFNNIDLFSLGINIRRVGLVRNYYLNAEIKKANKLLNNDFSTINLKEITLRINHVTKVKDCDCNNIEQIDYSDSIDYTHNGSIQRLSGYIIRRDINTLNELTIELVKDDRKTLIDEFMRLSEEFVLRSKLS